MKSKSFLLLQILKYIFFGSGLLLLIVAFFTRNSISHMTNFFCVLVALMLCASCVSGYFTRKAAENTTEEDDGEYKGTFSYFNIGMLVVTIFSLFLVPILIIFTLNYNEISEYAFFIIFMTAILAMSGNMLFTSRTYGAYIVSEDGIKIVLPFSTKKYSYNDISKCYPKIETHSVGSRYHRPVTFIILDVNLKDGNQFTVSHSLTDDAINTKEKYNDIMDNHRDSKMAKYINDHIDLNS